MFYPHADRKSLNAKVQAPFVLAEIRALRSSIFKNSVEVQQALAIATAVEQKYDLNRADLYVPALETFCAILEPLSGTLLTGTMRRVGYEIFPQYVTILGIPKSNLMEAMGIKSKGDLVSLICNSYTQQGVIGPDAGALSPAATPTGMTVTDTTFMPCQLQIGVFLGAAKLTNLFRDSALVEKRCRTKGDTVCVYDFTF